PSPYGQQPPYAQQSPYAQQPPYAQPYPYGQPNPYGQPQPYSQYPAAPRKEFWTTRKIVWTVVGIFLGVVLCGGAAVLSLTSAISNPHPKSAAGPGDYPDYQPLDEPPPTLGIGWCVSRIEGATSDPTAWAVPCKQHHRGEVFEIIPITGNSYPGDDSL